MYSRAINWYLQRITGAALLLLLILHFWVEHFTTEVRHGGLTFEVIQQRFFQNRWFVAIDIAFLLIALYHGLNGVRNIIFDFGCVRARYRIAVTVLLVVVGLIIAYWGIDALVGNPHLIPPEAKLVAGR
jgi:succinate dehydrogenase / fumarate reductase, membrane anchor subunit